MPRNSFRIIGHRGNGAGPDENTLGSCRAAMRAGATVIELDVRLIAGKLLLGHGPRPTGKLSEVLPSIRVPLVLHLKRHRLSRRHDRAALARLARVTHRPGLVVSSCWPGTLRHAKRYYPKLRTAFITRWLGWDRRFAGSLGVAEIHAWHRTITRQAVVRTQADGRRVIGFVPDDPGQVVGVDGVITDRVDRFSKSRRHP